MKFSFNWSLVFSLLLKLKTLPVHFNMKLWGLPGFMLVGNQQSIRLPRQDTKTFSPHNLDKQVASKHGIILTLWGIRNWRNYHTHCYDWFPTSSILLFLQLDRIALSLLPFQVPPFRRPPMERNLSPQRNRQKRLRGVYRSGSSQISLRAVKRGRCSHLPDYDNSSDCQCRPSSCKGDLPDLC